jgi:hypothetical protein
MIEVLKQALEFIERVNKDGWILADFEPEMYATITAIKEALAQPEQEPVAYINVEKRRLEFAHEYVKWDTPTTVKLDKIPLYTHPSQRTWVGLSDDEHCDIWYKESLDWMEYGKAIEAKLREKNSPHKEKNT